MLQTISHSFLFIVHFSYIITFLHSCFLCWPFGWALITFYLKCRLNYVWYYLLHFFCLLLGRLYSFHHYHTALFGNGNNALVYCCVGLYPKASCNELNPASRAIRSNPLKFLISKV